MVLVVLKRPNPKKFMFMLMSRTSSLAHKLLMLMFMLMSQLSSLADKRLMLMFILMWRLS